MMKNVNLAWKTSTSQSKDNYDPSLPAKPESFNSECNPDSKTQANRLK